MLHGLGAMLHFFGEDVELGVDLGALVFDRGEFTGQDDAQLGAHFLAQAGVALGLGGLTLQ